MRDEVQEFLESIEVSEFDAAEVVVPQGREPAVIGYIRDGIVKGVVHPKYGPVESAVLSVLGEGHWLGLECLSKGFNIEYVAVAPVRVALLPRSELEAQVPKELLRSLVNESGWQLARSMTLSYLNKLSLRKRVLSRLCDLREATAIHEIQITHEELASLVGVHRNKVGEVLKELESEGLVECGYREIMIGDRDQLLKAFQGTD